MSIEVERDRLLQKKWLEDFIPNIGTKPWIRVYEVSPELWPEQIAIFCGLLPYGNVNESLSTNQWDIFIGDFAPSLLQSYGGHKGEQEGVYDRFGHQQFGIEPLIIRRQFRDLRPELIEISEEFRLYHNLFFESSTSTFVKFDDVGDAIPVAQIAESHVDISRKHIRQFLAAKRMSLAVYFERMCFSRCTLDQLSLDEKDTDSVNPTCVYRLSLINCESWMHRNEKSQSWILGKKIIEGLPFEKCGVWPYEEQNEYYEQEFTIGIDANDEPILCSPRLVRVPPAAEIADSLGDSVKVSYVTPVYFDREVLSKYFNQPNKYSVEDGHVSCAGIWSLRMDNNHDKYVIVYLGHLARELPVKEQPHWKRYNIPPQGDLSTTGYRRTVLGEFANPDDDAFRFQIAYECFSSAWLTRFGWALFKPLSETDTHHFRKLRRPLTNEPTEFNDIVLSLSILLQDSINIKELRKLIPDFESKDPDGIDKRSISILGEYLEAQGLSDAAQYIVYMRMLQLLRSNSGTVHRRNEKEYRKAEHFFSLDTKSTVQVADDIFTTLAEFLNSLREHFCPDDET